MLKIDAFRRAAVSEGFDMNTLHSSYRGVTTDIIDRQLPGLPLRGHDHDGLYGPQPDNMKVSQMTVGQEEVSLRYMYIQYWYSGN